MTRRVLSCVAVLALLAGGQGVSAASKKGGSSKGASHAASKSKSSTAKAAKPRAPKAIKAPKAAKQPATPKASVPRTEKGRIQRSAAARHAFARQTGYPNGRPGYVIDHIKPLACGGADAPSNMQWQTIAEAKAKDKVERKGC